MGNHPIGFSLLLFATGCAGSLGSASVGDPYEPRDPTPLAKCRVVASASNPLVTEWPASEKAHLQSLASQQAVAVEYEGCDLRIIPECRLPGTYAWHRTTIATDTLEIRSADDLYAKLPIGAIGLEGELERSGRLAVRTTIAGQLRLQAVDLASRSEGCRNATHVVTAISVGTFMLSSGEEAASGGGAGVMGIGAGVRSTRERIVLRTAGDPTKCSEIREEGPNLDCASPIQLFLTALSQPVEPVEPVASMTPPPQAYPKPTLPGAHASEISFAAPSDGAVWSLRDADGITICQLPCTTWVPRMSGYSLRRERPLAEIELPAKLSLAHGSRATATYRAARGSPTLSELAFYFGGIPTAAIAVGFGIWGAVQVGRECTDLRGEPDSCFPSAGMLFATSGMMASFAGASLIWYAYSNEDELDIKPASSATFKRGIGVSPFSIHGTF